MSDGRYDGMRVLLRGDHPWAGNSGTVIKETTAAGSPCLQVRIDHIAQEVMAFPGQWSRLTSEGRDRADS